MNNDLQINIKTKTDGGIEIKRLSDQLEALGNIRSFVKLKEDVKASETAWKSAEGEVVKFAKKISSVDKPTEKLSADFKKAVATAKKLKTEFVSNQKSLNDLRKTLSKAGVNTTKLAVEQKKLKVALSASKREVDKIAKINLARGMLNVRPFKDIQHEIKATKNAYITLKNSGKLSSAELYKAQLQLSKRISSLKQETNGWVKSITRAKAGLASLAAVGYTAAKSFAGFSDFEQKMAAINTMVDISQPQLASLSDEILNLSTEIPQTASELASAEYQILSAGVKLSDSTTVLKLAAKAAIGGMTDTKTAVDVGTGVLNAYGKPISELGNVYDILFKTVKGGKTTFSELSQSIGGVLPSARAADVDFTEVAGAIATMTKAGIMTPHAVTALKGAIQALSAPTPEAKKRFDALGITWKGLIPTLKKLSKTASSLDQMRALIPDSEARTGVLSMIQNMDELTKSVEGMAHASGESQEATDKMMKAAAQQIKLFKNEISKLGIELGGLLSKGLLPVAKTFRELFENIKETDPVTKTLVGTLTGATGGFILWKAGLDTIVLGLKGIGLEIVSLPAKLAAVTAAGEGAAGALAGVGVALGAVYGAYEIARFVKTIYGWRDAVNEAKQAQDRLYENSDRLMEKFAQFKNVKIPDDITGKAPEELEELATKFHKAKAYWLALRNQLQQKSEETTWLGTATKDAIAAKTQLRGVNTRLAEIYKGLKTVAAAAKKAGEGMKEPVRALNATNDQLDSFRQQAHKAYEYASAQAKKYADKVIALEQKIRDARMSTTDKIRELGRKGLSEEAQWNDRRLEAEQKMQAARAALRNSDFQLAKKLAKQSENLYLSLAQKVKTKDSSGKDVVVKTIKDTKKIAIEGVKDVGDFMVKVYDKQKTSAEKSKKQWEKTAASIKEKLDDIAKDRIANVQIKLKKLLDAQKKINALIKDETKTIHIRTVYEKAGKSPVKKQAGGWLPGYGGGDRIQALLEAGEFVIRKEAVKKYGVMRLHSINNMSLPGFQEGGLVDRFVSGTAAGTLKTRQAEQTLVVRFQAGDFEAPVRVTDPDSRKAVRKMADELAKMRLIYAG